MKIRLSYQGWIFGATVLVVLLTLAFVAAFLQRSLREQAVNQVRETLFLEAGIVREIVKDRLPPARDLEAVDALADFLGQRLRMRVTLIDPNGTVLGDSELDLAELGAVENHAGRPEVVQALAEGEGWSMRYSRTVGSELIYAAHLLGTPDNPGIIVRMAMPFSDFDQGVDRVWRLILWASLLGIILSLGVAFLASLQISRPVRELTRTALSISSGDLTRRMRRYPNHEIGDLGRAFDRMADSLQEEIVEVTRARDRLEAILRGMVEGVLVTDGSGRITQANRALRELLDLSAYPIGRTPSEILRNADLIGAFQQVSGPAPYASLEIRTLGKNPRVLQVEMAALPGEGPRAGVVAVFHDVTERKRTEEMRKDFVANVSHELRTPLAAVKAAVETLLSGALDKPDTARRFTETIKRQTERLEGIVLDLLTLARLESDEIEHKDEQLDLRRLSESCVAMVVDLAESRGIALERTLPETPVYFQGEPGQIEQAIVNLLDNALKYTGPGGKISMVLKTEGNEIRLSVTDTGPGIPPEHLPRIFERFYRVDKNRSRSIGGTGLGLAIVKHVAQIHEGRVEVQSFPGRGSTFTLILPLRLQLS